MAAAVGRAPSSATLPDPRRLLNYARYFREGGSPSSGISRVRHSLRAEEEEKNVTGWADALVVAAPLFLLAVVHGFLFSFVFLFIFVLRFLD